MISLISQHIPKTAGTAFSVQLEAWFPRAVSHDYERQYPMETTLRLSPASRIRRSVRRRRRGTARNPVVVHGHLDLRRALKEWPSANVVTWLRDPVERVVSQYAYWRAAGESIHPVARLMRSEGWSLLDFASYPDNRNLQSRYISPLDISDFLFVGVTCKYNLSVSLLAESLGKNVSHAQSVHNRTPASARMFAGIADRDRARILELNSLDAALHEAARAEIARLADD